MLRGSNSISYYSPGNLAIWMLMGFQAGLINIGGFMSAHTMVTHVTGFATQFGHELSKPESPNAWNLLAVPLFFLLGAMFSGQLVDIPLQRDQRPKYHITFGCMFLLMLVVFIGGINGYFGQFGEWNLGHQNYLLLFLLCLTSGIQNGTISTVSRSVVRTTHLTGITTDFGLGIVRLLNRRSIGEKIKDEDKATLMRAGIIICFILGSVIGAVVYRHYQYMGFALPTAVSGLMFGLMVYFNFRKSSRERE